MRPRADYDLKKRKTDEIGRKGECTREFIYHRNITMKLFTLIAFAALSNFIAPGITLLIVNVCTFMLCFDF